ncbi:L-serine ammonia-lyase, iron-sulfur-dependent, subunit alpha [Diplocloster hominis]|uniref:L-serine ammonia-lyase, iron-sulfur-dependent, subunit alpha n=1 Tax=Diplocloster hominis TaxID=3079010 RepID=UPI0031BA515F
MFETIEAALAACREKELPLWKIFLEDDCRDRGVSIEASLKQMQLLWKRMKESGDSYDGALRSKSGLSGGDGAKMAAYIQKEDSLSNGLIGEIIAQALQMGESNACMRRIVAAPTAGSCGVLPALLLPLYRRKLADDQQVTEALYVAAGFGQVVATRATIAGAEGGCQAEVGTASAMAAAAFVIQQGGTAEMAAHAMAMALKNLLGLVCDPVAGLVEVPCVKRNVIGAVNAFSAAQMALAGIESRIPADEVIDAMADIGTLLPSCLRETGQGGLAATKTGCDIARELHANPD